MIRLAPMAEARFREFWEATIARYADDNVAAGRWAQEGALARSRAEHERLLPKGLATPDEYLRDILDAASGERVGEVWYSHRSEDGPKQIWIFWLGIDPAHRRHGYAEAALAAVEGEARRLGSDRVGLHVFAANTGARALYEKVGFVTTNLVMWKDARR